MAQSEIAVLIRAVDEVSATVKNIEKNLGGMQEEVRKQTVATSQTFDKQMGSLLVLGNAASRVDSIFSSYQNLQLRLANASERVENAQDHLADTQRNLERLQKSGVATAEQLYDANLAVERASRGLTIAQNNQARAQNLVWGTYIQIGLSVVTLLASLPALATALVGVATGIKAMTLAGLAFLATPIGIAIAAIGVALAVAGYGWYKHKQEVDANTEAVNKNLAEVDKLTASFEEQQQAFLTGLPLQNQNILLLYQEVSANNAVTSAVREQTEAYTENTSAFARMIAATAKYNRRSGGSRVVETVEQRNAIMGSRQEGGPITQTGPYLLHEGEYVMPKGDGGKVIVNIGTVHGVGLTVDELAEKLQDRLQVLITT